jgi:hypothetical protein
MFTKDTETRSLEEQAQLVRVFKYLSVEIPLRRVERKIKVSKSEFYGLSN